jgi:hypothetical protein
MAIGQVIGQSGGGDIVNGVEELFIVETGETTLVIL